MIEEAQLSLKLSEERGVFTVSDLAGGLRELVETAYDDVRVEGELSNFKQHRSGHCYFTLKDENAQLRCVMWRHFTRYVFFEPRDGMLVRVRGNISVYEARGDLQLLARSMQVAGEGALQKAFEELKRKLGAEGLFDADRKRPIPLFPRRIGLITSGSGAALQDILTVLRRRFPAVEVVLCPVQVQGMGASDQIASAIRCFNDLVEDADRRVDVMIVGRGGGSIEDLWAFNEESVARAIAASQIPIVSAVGHETDYSMADYVADRRAATPSMAAEIVVPDQEDVRAWLRGSVDSAGSCVQRAVERRRQYVKSILRTRAFHRPEDRVRQLIQRFDDAGTRLHRASERLVAAHRRHIEGCIRQLTLLDPSRPLERGYARVERDGRIVRSSGELSGGDDVTLTFHDGSRSARVEP